MLRKLLLDTVDYYSSFLISFTHYSWRKECITNSLYWSLTSSILFRIVYLRYGWQHQGGATNLIVCILTLRGREGSLVSRPYQCTGYGVIFSIGACRRLNCILNNLNFTNMPLMRSRSSIFFIKLRIGMAFFQAILQRFGLGFRG